MIVDFAQCLYNYSRQFLQSLAVGGIVVALVLKDFVTLLNGDVLSGSDDGAVFDARIWGSGTIPEKGVLYIAEDDITVDRDASIIRVLDGSADEALRLAHALLVDDYRRGIALTALFDAVLDGAAVNDAVRLCQEVMRGPVWILDERRSVIIFSDTGWNLKLPYIKDDDGVEDTVTFAAAGVDCHYRIMMESVRRNGRTIGYVLTCRSDDDFGAALLDGRYLRVVCDILAERPVLFYSESEALRTEGFLLDIIRRRLTDPVEIRRMVDDIDYKESEKYYVLSIDTGESGLSMRQKRELESAASVRMYDYWHYCIAVIGCDIERNISASDMSELVAFLEENNLYAGLSNAVRNLSMLADAFDQSTVVIPLRKRFSQERLARYEDLIFIHLLDVANKNGIPVLSLCHPAVTWIYEYDKAHGTDYMRTLTAYVLNELDLHRTANALFIHRNTLYHRICNLKERFKIDFDNPRLVFKLRNSVMIYLYINNQQTIDLMGQLV